MTQSQLNRAVSRATGEDYDLIDHRGFSLLDDELPLQNDDLEAQMIDWDQIQADQATAMFRDRQEPHMAA
jgi:hypothetical protein